MYLGDTQIYKMFFGDTEIYKGYLGDTEVFGAAGPTPWSNCIKFTLEDATQVNSIGYTSTTEGGVNMEYSTDGIHWYGWGGNSITMNGDTPSVGVRGLNTRFGNVDGTKYTSFTFSSSTALVRCEGNIMTLLDYNNPTTSLATKGYCFHRLFYNCAALTTPPFLPATVLEHHCYSYMFTNCSNLTTAPELPATSANGGCYQYMFRNCTSLTSAPELPAETLKESCYYYMFYGCSNLSYVKCLATSISATNALRNWVSSVSSTGTFVAANSSVNWPSGNNGIPNGWTVLYNE